MSALIGQSGRLLSWVPGFLSFDRSKKTTSCPHHPSPLFSMDQEWVPISNTGTDLIRQMGSIDGNVFNGLNRAKKRERGSGVRPEEGGRGLSRGETPSRLPIPGSGDRGGGWGPATSLPPPLGPRPPGPGRTSQESAVRGWLSSPLHPRSDATELRQWDAALRVCPPVENSKRSLLPQPLGERSAASPGTRPPSLA